MKTVLFLFLTLTLTTLFAQERKVLIIGIDGCRGDAIAAANAPHLDSLALAGFRCYQGNTHPPTWSATGWSTMLTGVWEQKHKAVDNSFTNNQFTTWPHFFARLNSVDPSLDLRSISHWAPINTAITTGADQELNLSTDQAVADAAVQLLQTGDPDVLFLQFDDVDHAGHAYGFLPTIANYTAAIDIVDQQVGQVIDAVRARPGDEQWMVVVTTDHGGNLSGHGGISFDEQRIFTFVSAPGIPAVERSAARDTITPPAHIAFSTGRHVRVASASPYQFGSAQDFTIECRVKMPTSWSGDPVFVGTKNWNSGLNPGWVLSTTTSGGNWKFNIGDGVDRIDLNGLPISDGQWHHLAVTCDRDGEVRIFQDGLLLRSAAMTTIGDVATALQLCIGQDGTTTYGTSLTGTVSDVRIWNVALPINTISSWSGKALNGGHPFQANLIGHWRLEEGSGGTIANQVSGAPTAQHFTNSASSAASWSVNTLHLVTTDLTRTPTQADLVPTIMGHLCIAIDPAWGYDGVSLVDACAPVDIAVRALLGGPYDAQSGSMNDGLRSAALLPSTEPYTSAGYTHRLKGGGEQMAPGVTDVAGPDAVVDWVVLEQRAGSDPSQVLSTATFLLQRDGDIVGPDGTSVPRWPVILGTHYLAVHHRNHGGVMSAVPLNFVAGTALSMDLSDPLTPVYGTEGGQVVNNVRVLWPGDVNGDGVIRYSGATNDRDAVLSAVGGSIPTNTVGGYRAEDVNLDGVVRYVGAGNDRDPILFTIGGSVPTAVRLVQVP
jgi:hypothetical protein